MALSNAVCSDSKDTVQVIVYRLPFAGTLASAATVCATANQVYFLLQVL